MSDQFTIRAVVVFLGLVALAALGLGGALAFAEKPVPDFVIGMGAGALAALGPLLARGGAGSVEISNTPSNPVPVETA